MSDTRNEKIEKVIESIIKIRSEVSFAIWERRKAVRIRKLVFLAIVREEGGLRTWVWTESDLVKWFNDACRHMISTGEDFDDSIQETRPHNREGESGGEEESEESRCVKAVERQHERFLTQEEAAS